MNILNLNSKQAVAERCYDEAKIGLPTETEPILILTVEFHIGGKLEKTALQHVSTQQTKNLSEKCQTLMVV